MPDTTTKATRELKCGYCRKDVHVGDEIGFGLIKNRTQINIVPICLRCFDIQARDAVQMEYDA